MRTCALCEATSAGTAVRWPNGTSAICTWCRSELKKRAHGFCPHCEKTWPLVEMRDGYCKTHKKAINKAYRAAHAARERERVAAYRKEHPRVSSHTPAQRRRYYLAHRSKELARSNAWYAAHRDEALARQRAQRAARGPDTGKYQRMKARLFRRLFTS